MRDIGFFATLLLVVTTPACIFFGLQDIPCEDSINCPTGYQCIFDHNDAAESPPVGICYSAEQLAEAEAKADPNVLCVNNNCCAQGPCRRMPDSSMYCANSDGPLASPPAAADPFSGQDCQHSSGINQFKKLSLEDEDPFSSSPKTLDVIQDSRTGLFWEARPAALRMRSEDVPGHCAALLLDEHVHWRSASMQELMTLVDFGGTNLALAAGGPELEEHNQASYFAGPARANFVGELSFIDGRVQIVDENKQNYAICVYGNEWKCPEEAEVETRPDAVEDLRSGLIWARAEAEAQNWQQSLQYCQDLQLEDQTDWRLPSAKEMSQLVDLHRGHDDVKVCRAIETGLAWSGTEDQQFWTSTPFVSSAVHQAWIWDLQYGKLGSLDMSAPGRIRCVRTRNP